MLYETIKKRDDKMSEGSVGIVTNHFLAMIFAVSAILAHHAHKK